MPGIPAALVAGLAALVAAAEPAGRPFGPLTRIDTQGGPTVWVRHGAALPLVAIRLSLPVQDGPVPGATRVLVELGREAMGDGAAVFGGRASAERVPGFAVFSVVGPARSFDAMVALLRRAVGEPSFDADALARARAAAQRAVASMLERPETRTRALLRQRMFGDSAGIEPGIPAVDSLTPDRLRQVWSAQFQPSRMRAIVVGDLPAPVIRAAFSHWPHRSVPQTAGPPVGAGPRPHPQVMFPWAGVAYRVPASAAAAVAAELVRLRAERSGLHDGAAELWWQAGEAALVVLGSTRGDTVRADSAAAGTPRLRADLETFVADALAAATPGAVDAAARAVRVDLLLAARSPAGAAEVIGRFMDASGGGAGAGELFAALEQVRADDVRALLRAATRQHPAFVEVAP